MPKSSRKPRRKRPPAKASPVEHVRIVVYRDGDAWLAHCLEFDLVAQGETAEEAARGIKDSIDAMFAYAGEHGDFRPLYRPAPAEVWEMFERATLKRKPGATPRARPELELVTA